MIKILESEYREKYTVKFSLKQWFDEKCLHRLPLSTVDRTLNKNFLEE